MIEIYTLKQRHTNDKAELSKELAHIKMFSTSVGHGVGRIDFSEKIAEFGENEWEKISQSGAEYTKFKLGNLSRYFEIEIFAEHAIKLLSDIFGKNFAQISMSDLSEITDQNLRKFCEILMNLSEGYLVVRKSL